MRQSFLSLHEECGPIVLERLKGPPHPNPLPPKGGEGDCVCILEGGPAANLHHTIFTTKIDDWPMIVGMGSSGLRLKAEGSPAFA